MLRNREANRHVDKALKILNEVLSLNAQEYLTLEFSAIGEFHPQ